MDELIQQVRAAAASNLYFVALLGVLAIPDICGALSSNDGKASGSKYKQWLRDNVPEQAGDADLIYGLRCSLLHQGQAQLEAARNALVAAAKQVSVLKAQRAASEANRRRQFLVGLQTEGGR